MKYLPLILTAQLFAAALFAADPPAGEPAAAVQHPALFLVGDSTVKTGKGHGEVGPWGWGSELAAHFDPAKIHVYNEGRGGRSSRSYREEGAWEKIRTQLRPGDFVILQFGHNDSANSANYPDRTTITGTGDQVIELGVGPAHKTVLTYGAYLRQYIADIRAAGATPLLCSPVPRDQWTQGKIRRGFDGYATWAAEVAHATGTALLDLNSLVSDRYDALGETATHDCFVDYQHTNLNGARLHAECVAAAIARLPDCPLAKALRSPSH